MSDKTNRLNIYLIKEEFSSFEEIIKPGHKEHAIDGVGMFYLQDSHAKTPSWLKDFFLNELDGKFALFSAGAKALLAVSIPWNGGSRLFAIAFGYGRLILTDGVVEERFGLKVVLNSVDPKSLRSIDKISLGAIAKQSREQISRAGETATFGIDIEQDLVNAVTGRSKNPALGKMISGRDSLSISVKINLKGICGFLPLCMQQYESKDYQTDFDWIDQIRDIRDTAQRDNLNVNLLQRLKNGDLDKIWMAAPSILDWVDTKGFKYSKAKSSELRDDLDIHDFLSTLKPEEVTLGALKSRLIYAVSSKNDTETEHWNAYSCLYAETTVGERVFILNQGKWYEIAAGFTKQVIEDFTAIPESQISLPHYTHKDEGAYNEYLPPVLANSCCMDRKLISYGGAHSSIEFCDLMTNSNQLVHIKRYGGSSHLSHLFNQGVVSGELFISDGAFRQKINEKLPATHKLPDVVNSPDARKWEIVFAIISKSNNPLDIPFFSKVSLRNAQRRLQTYGYKVSKKKIQITPPTT
jgi:uncharacterized protein (TIGR04141 family)